MVNHQFSQFSQKNTPEQPGVLGGELTVTAWKKGVSNRT
jgi:hypothetical protein